jgi:hypothetical protein
MGLYLGGLAVLLAVHSDIYHLKVVRWSRQLFDIGLTGTLSRVADRKLQ